jgi:hypothetical protein
VKILKGGSLEVERNKWQKFDIELDESDLQAIVVTNGIDSAKLTVVQKFTVLSKQAEILVTAQMESVGASGDRPLSQLVPEFKGYLASLPKVTEDAPGV